MKYSVGLDIGTGSVGWAVIGEDYRLKRTKGKNLIGVRLFEGADTAAERRGYRTTRRRLSRRRWRLRLLNDIFASELSKIDENFLPRLKYSWVNKNDTDNVHFGVGVFDNSEQEKAFYQDYPTIYHLRQKLMTDNRQHDLREVYLAIHHIVKYRGHFLNSGEISANSSFDAQKFLALLREFDNTFYPDAVKFLNLDQLDLPDKISSEISYSKISKSERVDRVLQHVQLANSGAKKILKAILNAVVGNSVDSVAMFSLSDLDKEEKKKINHPVTDSKPFKYSDEEVEAKLDELSNLLQDEQKIEFLSLLKLSFDGLTLKMLLGNAKSVSEAMVERYKVHKDDLKFIKENILNSFSKDKKKEFDKYYEAHLAEKDVDNVDKYFKKIIDDSIISKDKKIELLQKIDDHDFLPSQRSKINGAIPHQLHRNELDKIISQQSKYYPFLADSYTQNGKTETKLAGLVNFRVPYYVGPLVSKENADRNNPDGGQNHWVEFKENTSLSNLTPWNFNEIVDKDKSAAKFIERLTGMDTYLIGEPTLPQNSLLYQKYNVLQELNNIRVDNHKLDVKIKQDVFEHLFKTQNSVSAKDVKNYLIANGYAAPSIQITGLSDTNEKTFNSKLSSYNYLVDKLGRTFVESVKSDVLEKIIELQTVFEDKTVLLRQLSMISELTLAQANQLAEKHWTGWGRLSRKLLSSKVVDVNKITNSTFYPATSRQTIIDTLYHTQLNLMEIINNAEDLYGVRQWISEQNKSDSSDTNDVYDQIQELAGDKKIKRGITQSFRILDDIVKAMGGEPERVYLEFARENQQSGVSFSRKNLLSKLYENDSLKQTFKELKSQLESETKENLQNDRLYLYYLQQGRDMYSNDELNIDQLSSYDIDHIIPQAYTKDNSFDNRVLVSSKANRLKTNASVVPSEVVEKMKPLWLRMKDQGFISKRKFENLTRRGDFSEQQKERFIARALVETRQIIVNVSSLIDSHFNHTKAVAVKSNMTTDMRHYTKVPKNRDINDYHHAHDALFVATVGQYIENKGFMKAGKLSDSVGNEYNRYTKKWIETARKNTNYGRVNPFGFVVGSMQTATRGKLDYETGELKVVKNNYWSKDDLDYLLKVVSYKKILVTTKLQDNKGAMYDANLISAKGSGKKKAQLQISKSKNIDLYGGFNKLQNEYSVLILNHDEYRWVSIPMYARNSSEQYLHDKYPDAKVILNHIPVGQPILLSNSSDPQKSKFASLRIATGGDYHNNFEFVPSVDVKKILDNIYLNHSVTDDEYKKVFESLLATLHDKFVFGIHQVMYNKIFDNKYLFDKMPDEAKRNVINSLLKFMNISKNQLGAVGKIGGKVNGVLYGFKTETEKGTSAG
ncbi:MAG: type II CRISPR RNA-guided endonuclease Cas9, partial [Leuconostoc falkenbergense]